MYRKQSTPSPGIRYFRPETEWNGGIGHRGDRPEVLGAKADDHVAKLGEVHRRRA